MKTFDANFVMTASFYNKTAFLYQAVGDFLRRFSSFKFSLITEIQMVSIHPGLVKQAMSPGNLSKGVFERRAHVNRKWTFYIPEH